MVFSSAVFLFMFLPFVLFGYHFIREKYRNIFLLLVSLLFYAWGGPKYVLLMGLSILINYLGGLLIDSIPKENDMGIRKLLFAVVILLNLGILIYFKYTNFIVDSVNSILKTNIVIRNIMLPIGISFYTFQGLSYIIDLYRGQVKVQKKLINLALYIALFPQLVAGPIVRYIDVNEQIENRDYNLEGYTIGVKRFIIGLSKKVIIANQVGMVVDEIFSLPANQNSIGIAWLGIICYTLQIYFDFSGYSDMAIGLGKIFGFDFQENFNYPYISKSISEFWRRWHISLSSWFRDYLYIPLGGNRKGNVYFNLLIVFLATGIWHGAAWNFVVWGIWHGIFIVIERLFRNSNKKVKIPSFIKWLYTMLIVIIGWVLFRAPNLGYAIQYLGVMFGIIASEKVGFTIMWYLTGRIIFALSIGIIASIPLVDLFRKKVKVLEGTYLELAIENTWLVVLLGISIILVMTSTYNPFIYFRF